MGPSTTAVLLASGAVAPSAKASASSRRRGAGRSASASAASSSAPESRSLRPASQATLSTCAGCAAKSRAAAPAMRGGLVGGLVGQSGAFILIPLLSHVIGVPTRVAIGTSLAVVFCAASTGTLGKIAAGQVVFPAAAGLIVLFVVLASLAPHRALMLFDEVQETIAHNLSWLYVSSMSLFLVFALGLAFSRFGRIRLGPDNERAEFGTFSWFAMLFSAGMGIGMLFWGVAEPLYHFKAPLSAKPESLAAAREAMGVTLFHWGLHPWALYSLVGLSLAYFGFRRGLPLSFRSVFYPLIGERIYGWLGNVIDIMAVKKTTRRRKMVSIRGIISTLGGEPERFLNLTASLRGLFQRPRGSLPEKSPPPRSRRGRFRPVSGKSCRESA